MMGIENSLKTAAVADTKDVLLGAIVTAVAEGWPAVAIKDLAVAYRLVAGGTQPGSAIVTAK